MKLLKILCLLSLLTSVACTITHPKLAPNSNPKNGHGYLAGGFKTSYRESFARMTLEIKETSTNESHLIELERPSDASKVEIHELPTGQYRLLHLVAMAASGGIINRYPIEKSELSKTFSIEPNQIHYIGHFDARSTNETSIATYLIHPSLKNSSYGFSFENKPISIVIKDLNATYPHFKHLITKKIFNEEKTQQLNRKESPF